MMPEHIVSLAGPCPPPRAFCCFLSTNWAWKEEGQPESGSVCQRPQAALLEQTHMLLQVCQPRLIFRSSETTDFQGVQWLRHPLASTIS
jgi:hypothetical protein